MLAPRSIVTPSPFPRFTTQPVSLVDSPVLCTSAMLSERMKARRYFNHVRYCQRTTQLNYLFLRSLVHLSADQGHRELVVRTFRHDSVSQSSCQLNENDYHSYLASGSRIGLLLALVDTLPLTLTASLYASSNIEGAY